MESERSARRIVLGLLGAYAAWLVTAVLSVGVLITWNTALLHLYRIGGFNKYGTALFNNLVVITLVGLWLALVVLAEGIFRRAAERGTVLTYFLRALAALAALWLLGSVLGRL